MLRPCGGVAHSRSAVSGFKPVGDHPHLVHKTDRIPSSIRLLPLSANGQHAAGTSVDLFRHDGVLENPVLIERPAGWVMLLSQGDFTRCSYRTIWRRSTSILDWSAATSGVLLDHKSGLCLPGGADVTPLPHSKRLRVYFHAWTCHGTSTPCGPAIHRDKVRHRSRAIRPMYAAGLRWVDGVPVIARFLVDSSGGLRAPDVLPSNVWAALQPHCHAVLGGESRKLHLAGRRDGAMVQVRVVPLWDKDGDEVEHLMVLVKDVEASAPSPSPRACATPHARVQPREAERHRRRALTTSWVSLPSHARVSRRCLEGGPGT